MNKSGLIGLKGNVTGRYPGSLWFNPEHYVAVRFRWRKGILQVEYYQNDPGGGRPHCADLYHLPTRRDRHSFFVWLRWHRDDPPAPEVDRDAAADLMRVMAAQVEAMSDDDFRKFFKIPPETVSKWDFVTFCHAILEAKAAHWFYDEDKTAELARVWLQRN